MSLKYNFKILQYNFEVCETKKKIGQTIYFLHVIIPFYIAVFIYKKTNQLNKTEIHLFISFRVSYNCVKKKNWNFE
jgi:hypothetical protein